MAGGFTHPVDLRWFQHTSTQDGRGGTDFCSKGHLFNTHTMDVLGCITWKKTQKNTKILILYILFVITCLYIYISVYIDCLEFRIVQSCISTLFDPVWPGICVLCCCMFVSLLQCYLHNNSIFIWISIYTYYTNIKISRLDKTRFECNKNILQESTRPVTTSSGIEVWTLKDDPGGLELDGWKRGNEIYRSVIRGGYHDK